MFALSQRGGPLAALETLRLCAADGKTWHFTLVALPCRGSFRLVFFTPFIRCCPAVTCRRTTLMKQNP